MYDSYSRHVLWNSYEVSVATKFRLHVNTDSVLAIIARRDALHRWSLAAIGPLGNWAALDESLDEIGASDTENDAGR